MEVVHRGGSKVLILRSSVMIHNESPLPLEIRCSLRDSDLPLITDPIGNTDWFLF